MLTNVTFCRILEDWNNYNVSKQIRNSIHFFWFHMHCKPIKSSSKFLCLVWNFRSWRRIELWPQFHLTNQYGKHPLEVQFALNRPFVLRHSRWNNLLMPSHCLLLSWLSNPVLSVSTTLALFRARNRKVV